MILIDDILKDKSPLIKLEKYGNFKPKSDKCLIVGSSNETLCKFDLNKYCTDFDGDIICIQKMNHKIPSNLKHKKISIWVKIPIIDDIRAWEKDTNKYDNIDSYNTLFSFNYLQYLNDTFYKEHSTEIPNIYKSFVDRHFTTGFLTILTMLYFYNKCEICGFGYSNKQYENSRMPQYYYEQTQDKKHTNGLQSHDFNLEHKFYDEWQEKLNDLFYRADEVMESYILNN